MREQSNLMPVITRVIAAYPGCKMAHQGGRWVLLDVRRVPVGGVHGTAREAWLEADTMAGGVRDRQVVRAALPHADCYYEATDAGSIYVVADGFTELGMAETPALAWRAAAARVGDGLVAEGRG